MGRRRDSAGAALIAIPALLLAGLSLLSARAAFMTLDADATLETVSAEHLPPPEKLVEAGNDYLAAAKWFESARYHTAAASAFVFASQNDRKITDGDIERPIRQALRASPASPFNWSRLAWLRYRAGDLKAAAKAWQMSVLTGRYKPAIMQSRVELGVALLPSQDAAFEEDLKDQIVVSARTDPGGLATLANRTGIHPVIRAFLEQDTESRAQYEAANQRVSAQMVQRAKAAKK